MCTIINFIINNQNDLFKMVEIFDIAVLLLLLLDKYIFFYEIKLF